MTASTNVYMELQSIYKQQCNIDIALLRSFIQQQQKAFESIHNISNSIDMNTFIDDEYIRTFCFNLNNIDIIMCHNGYNSDPINDDDTEHMKCDDNENTSSNDGDAMGQELSTVLDDFTDNDDTSADVQIPLLWYICHEACQLFFQKEHRYPGTFQIDHPNHDMDIQNEDVLLLQDAIQLQTYIVKILKHDPKYIGIITHPVIQRTLLQPYHPSAAAGTTTTTTTTTVDPPHPLPSKYAVEMVRYGNCEIHTIGSIMGGIAAQELIKIITYQYVPIQTTYVYNGITSTGAVYNM